MPLRLRALAVAGLTAVLLAAAAPSDADVDVELPPTGPDVDYQLGGASTPPDHVGIVVRDRRADPAAGTYGVCYVNGFQTQPDERRFWRQRPGLILHEHGRPVVDEAWGEKLLDLRTSRKRHRLAAIMGRWAADCAGAGYRAVEFDNLDSFTRSHGLVRRAQATRYARLLTRAAHDAGLAAGQKNLAGFDGRTVGYDFAVAEECGRYDECDSYVAHYGARVLAVEYRARDFRATCREYADLLPVVLRDRDVTPDGVHRWC